MAACTVPVCKQALLDVMAARPALANVTRTWGRPEGETFAREHIYLGNADGSREWGPIRPPVEQLEEIYTIELGVSVERPGGTHAQQQATEERAFALLNEVEVGIRADPSLGGTIRFVYVRRFAQNNEPLPKGWTTQIRALVECHARI